MKNKTIINELRRSIGYRLALGVFFQLLLLLVGGLEDWSFASQVDGFYLFSISRENALFLLFSPLAAIIPYALQFLGDWEQRIIYHSLHRCGKRAFVSSKIIATIMSGALATALGTLLYALICICFAPADSKIVEAWRTYGDGTWLEHFFRSYSGREYMFVCVGLDAIAGSIWSAIALLLSCILRSKVASLLGTAILFFSFVRIHDLRALYYPSSYYVPTIDQPVKELSDILITQIVVLCILCVLIVFFMSYKLKELGLAKKKKTCSLRLNRYITKNNKWIWITTIFLILIRTLLLDNYQESIYEQLLNCMGGIPFEESINVNSLSQWFLLLLPLIIYNSLLLKNNFSSWRYMTIHRFGRKKAWLFNIIRKQVMFCLAYVLIQFASVLLWGACKGTNFDAIANNSINGYSSYVGFFICILIIPFLSIHFFVLCCLETSAFFFSKSVTVSAVIVLLIHAITIVISNYPGTIWNLESNGMLLRSSIFYEEQIPLSLCFLFQTTMIVLLILLELFELRGIIAINHKNGDRTYD